jgi:membrane protein required for colicin V production
MAGLLKPPLEHSVTFTWIDYVIFGLIGLSAIIGLFRGFVREALSLVTWGVAIWVALTFTPLASSYLEPYLDTPSLRQIAAFAGLFIATLIVGAIINSLICLLVRKSGIGGTDRFLGLLFGVVRGALVVAILVLLAGLTPLPEDPWWQESQAMPYFEELATTLRGFLPEDIAKDFQFDPAKMVDSMLPGQTSGTPTDPGDAAAAPADGGGNADPASGSTSAAPSERPPAPAVTP